MNIHAKHTYQTIYLPTYSTNANFILPKKTPL